GHSVARQQNVSEETARLIDAEVKRLVQDAYDEARRILTENIDGLHALAQALLEFETLSGDEIKELLETGKRPEREESGSAVIGPSLAVPATPAEPDAEAARTVH